MASIQKRNKKYAVVYTYEDSQGNKKQKWEAFDSYNEARIRKSEVESQKDKNIFIPPSSQTMNEFLDLFIDLYGVDVYKRQNLTSSLLTIFAFRKIGLCVLKINCAFFLLISLS